MEYEVDEFRDHNPKIRAGQIACKKTRKLKILKAVQNLMHACGCTDRVCDNSDCDRMKSTVIHFKICTYRPKKNCQSCQQLIALCRYHAKSTNDCDSKQCAVPCCAKIKHLMKLKQNQRKEKSKQQEVINENMQPSTSCATETWTPAPNDNLTATQTPPANDHLNALQTPAANGHLTEMQMPVSNHNLTETQTPASNNHLSATQTPALNDNLPESVSQLKMLLHSHGCLTDEIHGVASWPCFETNCGIMKQVLRHIFQCNNDAYCTVLHCVSSKSLITHWNTCGSLECQLCVHVRQSQGRHNSIPLTGRDLPSATQMTDITKEWQREVRSEVREFVIHKIENSMIELANLTEGERGMVTYIAKSNERTMFHAANSREEYYRLICEKITYNINCRNNQVYLTQQGKEDLFAGIKRILQGEPSLQRDRFASIFNHRPHLLQWLFRASRKPY